MGFDTSTIRHLSKISRYKINTCMLMNLLATAKANKLKTTLLTVASILGAISTIWGFRTVYDGLNLPRPAFVSELNELRSQVTDIELEYRYRVIRNDQRNLREAEKQIIELTRQRVAIPDGLEEYIQDLRSSIERNQYRIKELEKSPG
jgi:hypothetical protein